MAGIELVPLNQRKKFIAKLAPEFDKLYYDTRQYKKPSVEEIVTLHKHQFERLLSEFKIRDIVQVVTTLYNPIRQQNEPPCPHEWFVLKSATDYDFSVLLDLIKQWKWSKDKPLLNNKTLLTRNAIVRILEEISQNCEELAAFKCLRESGQIDEIIRSLPMDLQDKCGYTPCRTKRGGSRRPRRKTRKLLRVSKLSRL